MEENWVVAIIRHDGNIYTLFSEQTNQSDENELGRSYCMNEDNARASALQLNRAFAHARIRLVAIAKEINKEDIWA